MGHRIIFTVHFPPIVGETPPPKLSSPQSKGAVLSPSGDLNIQCFLLVPGWERKYNSYLKTVSGYASTLKACSHLYDDGVRIFINLCDLKKAISQNPHGIVATMSMNNLYIETATELITVYSILKDAVAKGGASNMLTGAERSKILWELNDRLAQFNKRLSQLSISIRYYTMADVWNRATAGMIDRNTAEIAGQALDRWHRCARIVTP